MKTKIVKYFFLVAVALFGACKTQKLQTSEGSTSIVEATIIQLNDVYEIDALNGGKVGGMARVAHIVRREKTKTPNVLTVLAGDFLNPSLLGTLKYNGERIRGRQMVEVMNAAGVDLVVFGNHEFDLKMPELQKRINESEFEWLGTNVWQITEEGKVPFHKVRQGIKKPVPNHYIWKVKNKAGVLAKIAFVGAIINSNPRDFVYYEDWTSAMQRELNILKESDVDYIIGLTHLDELQDLQLAEDVDALDLILGGHDHNHMALEANNTPIYKADANAKTVYIHRLRYNQKTGKTSVQSVLLPLDETVPADENVQKIIDRWNSILMSEVGQIIDNPNEKLYEAKVPLDGREHSIRYRPTNLGQMAADAFLHASTKAADCAIINSGSFRLDDQLSGAVYAIDIFRSLPYGGYMVEVNMKGTLLLQVLQAGERAKGNGAYLQRSSNVEYDQDRDEWFVNDELLDEQKNYTVCMSDFLLTGYDIDFLTDAHPDILWIDKPDKMDKTDHRNDIRKLIIGFFKSMER